MNPDNMFLKKASLIHLEIQLIHELIHREGGHILILQTCFVIQYLSLNKQTNMKFGIHYSQL